MPKRRLPNEGGGNKPPPRQLQSQLEIKEQPRPPRASLLRKSSDTLISLSNACNKHGTYHKGRKAPSRLVEDVNIPDRCQKDLDALTKLLPKVEGGLEPPSRGNEGPAAHDVANLCDFYNSVMRGTYCPYAPHLFRLGKDPDPILKRVLNLFRHIMTPAVLETARSAPSASQDETSLQSVVDVISRTIGRLFGFLEDSSVHSAIVSDIVDLLADCSEILQNQMLPVRLDILDNTQLHFSLEPRSHSDFFLELHSHSQVWLLQASALTILETFLLEAKTKRLSIHALAPEINGETFSPGNVDLVFHSDLIKQDTIPILLEDVIGRILLSDPNEFISDFPLWQRRQLASARMLDQLVNDWVFSSGTPAATFFQASVLVARATLQYLGRGDENFDDYATLIAVILHRTILDTPIIQGISDETPFVEEDERDQDYISRKIMLLPVLLDCIGPIAKRSTTSRNKLDILVMRILDAILKPTKTYFRRISPEQTFASNYAVSHGIYQALFLLVRDPLLSNFAVGIFGSLSYSENRMEDINGLCFSVLESRTKKCENDFEIVNNTIISTNRSTINKDTVVGSKRKRLDESSSSLVGPSQSTQILKMIGTNVDLISPRYSWHKALRVLLEDSLASGRQLSTSSDRVRMQSNSSRNRSASNSFADAALLSGALKCICYIIFLQYWSEASLASSNLLGCLQIINIFFARLKQKCDDLESTDLENMSDMECCVAEVASDCGLFLHFTCSPIFFHLYEISEEVQSLNKCFADMASIASRLSTARLLGVTTSTFSISQKCTCNWRASCLKSVVGVPNNNIQENTRSTCTVPLCLGSYLEQLDNATLLRGDSFFRVISFSSSFSALSSIPLRSRLCMLWTLSFGYGCSDFSDPRQAVSKGQEILNALSKVIQESMQSSITREERRSHLVCVLNLAPSLLVSLSLKVNATTAGNNGESVSVANTKNDSISALSKTFVEKILRPFLCADSLKDTEICEAILLLSKRLQSFQRSGNTCKLGLWEFTASSAVEFLLGRDPCVQESSEQPRGGESDRIFDDFIHDIALKLAPGDISHFARKLLWDCIADLVVASPAVTCHSRSLLEFNASSNRESIRSRDTGRWLFWLMEAPFSEGDSVLRMHAARRLAQVVLDERYYFLLSLFSSEEDWEIFSRNPDPNENVSDEDLIDVTNKISDAFFRSIDMLMRDKCGISDYFLSFTMTKPSSDDAEENQANGSKDQAAVIRSTVRILASLCTHTTYGHPLGKSIRGKAFLRLGGLWASNPTARAEISSVPDIPSTGACRALACGELTRCSQNHFSQLHISSFLPDVTTVTIFCDVLGSNIDRNDSAKYLNLENFIQLFLLERPDNLSGKQILKDTSSYFESKLAVFISHLINEKLMEFICLTVGFREYLAEKLKDAKKIFGSGNSLIGCPNVRIDRSLQMAILPRRDLERKAKNMCLEPNLIELILPRILVNLDDSSLKFFTKNVLKDSMKLHEIIANRKQKILKALVWELGSDETPAASAHLALKVAAIAARQGSQSANDDESSPPVAASSLHGAAEAQGYSGATQWVTESFLFLLVNTVQFKWNARSARERLQALRSLYEVMDYLLPSASAQFFPHILATVNAAIMNGDASQGLLEIKRADFIRLQYSATKCLRKFVELVAGYQFDPIAHNLTTVVVSLIPLLREDSIDWTVGETSIIQDTRNVAISLLEFLTNGNLGKHLAPFFREIPFLPPSPTLAKVYEALRKNGVDFDNLLVLSSSTAIQEGRTATFPTTEISSTLDSRASTSSSSVGIEKVPALQKRLNMICTLLNHENTSVRNVALQHLIDLLRANRGLFHSLIESEGIATMKQYLTILSPDEQRGNPDAKGGCTLLPRGTVTEMMEMLLTRCVQEGDSATRVLLATCIGELGAIGEHNLGELNIGGAPGDESLDTENSHSRWRLDQPPWQSRSARYELELITRHLVVGLKAAQSSESQHKIAFTIQQLLHGLNDSTTQSENIEKSREQGQTRKSEMGKWLRAYLQDAGVLEIVEPFWSSEFSEKAEGYIAKQPPFFRFSPSYFKWMSSFCRWMIYSANNSARSPWKSFFFNCRQAVRTEAGLRVAEFIFPILVLDRFCFGSGTEEELIRQEFLDVLTFEQNDESTWAMNQTDRQRAVSAFFSMMDTLTFWAENGTEDRFKSSRGSLRLFNQRKLQREKDGDLAATSWRADETIGRIDEVLSKIPLDKQAQAASRVGMHARALRLLEFAGRKKTVEQVFEAVKDSPGRSYKYFDDPMSNLELRKDLLAKLDDCDSMAVVGGGSVTIAPSLRIRDSIRQKEASGDFQGALKDYERALQLEGSHNRDSSLQIGALQCMLELGHFDSVLKQAAGLKLHNQDSQMSTSDSCAVEAAWRLGRWETLSELLDDDGKARKSREPLFQSYDKYQMCFGKALLGLQKKNGAEVAKSLQAAREASMETLAVVARENYSRSYPEIVRLHCLRELENASEILCKEGDFRDVTFGEAARSNSNDGWAWDGRLNLVSSRGASSIISTRVALARICADPVLEGSLFLRIGKQARKNRHYAAAENFLSQAESVLSMASCDSPSKQKLCQMLYSVTVQMAKLKYECGEGTLALRLVEQESVQHVCDRMIPELNDVAKIRSIAVNYERRLLLNTRGMNTDDNEEILSGRFVSRLLKVTQWMVESGLTGGTEVIGRFRVIHQLAPKWEKGHFQFAKFLDSLMQARVTKMARERVASDLFSSKEMDSIRAAVVGFDKNCQKYITQSMHHYVSALNHSTKHVFQALPRLLSLWFEITLITKQEVSAIFGDNFPNECLDALEDAKKRANQIMAAQVKSIPADAFYTAMPQLISRVTHGNNDTALVVQSILQRVLVKFPQQAMWPLAWLKGSMMGERNTIGDNIFNRAQIGLLSKNSRKMQKLLVNADSLFRFLKNLATHPANVNNGVMNVKPWKGEIELAEFLPPVQAALSISPGESNGSKDFFPRNVPRMRTFSPQVSVMSSKAKPKKLKAFAVPAGYIPSANNSATSANDAVAQPGDIGEIHFLVKQEAKGDLRKDARVQDLNNVINRLMASAGGSVVPSRSKRRLRLRTFTVTCLSEHTGILEWVPDTDSLRNLVTKSYNPQTSAFCSRRRGAGLANFGDMNLRNQYGRAQNAYIKDGDLTRAGALFAELCAQFPPVLYWWFVQRFHDPHAWYEARNRFALSAAAWSAVGHVIGLGDRHSENILVDTTSGECVHVDFDCIFDKGLDLPRPEVVPFRLTQNMLDAFGPTGSDGIYSSGLQTAMATLRENHDTLLSVLEPFTKDPIIDWRSHRGQQKQSCKILQDKRRAKEAIKVIDERLRGIYNLRNPNFTKIRRTDATSMDNQEDLTTMSPLSVNAQVYKMIAEATSNENLVQLYVGWMSWL